MVMPDHLEEEFNKFVKSQDYQCRGGCGPSSVFDWFERVQLAFIAGHNVASIEDNEYINPVI